MVVSVDVNALQYSKNLGVRNRLKLITDNIIKLTLRTCYLLVTQTTIRCH